MRTKRKAKTGKSGRPPRSRRPSRTEATGGGASGTYAVIGVRELPADLETELTEFLFGLGCSGTEQILPFTQANLRYEPRIVRENTIHLAAYFEESGLERAALALRGWLRSRSAQAEVSCEIRRNRDWLSEWKKHYKPLDVGGFHIIPRWLKPRRGRGGSRLIRIEPGMAFGTGTHPTTQYALRMLEKAARVAGPRARSWKVLDVGAGSGILSVAAERLGAASVRAIDNDPVAWDVCLGNFRLNGVKRCKVLKKQVGELRGSYDLVLANIIDGVLMEIGPHLRARVAKGGFLVLSGILADGLSAFLPAFFEGGGFEIVDQAQDAEWAACLARRLT